MALYSRIVLTPGCGPAPRAAGPAFAALLLALVVAAGAHAEGPAATGFEGDDLFELSLEELIDVQVISVAGVEQDWFLTPAAITVVTGEQLRRSGLTTLAEALRLVPGVHVGRVDSRQWAVTARGFSDLFSNKLQVVIDGRVVYNELFGGVFWDVQNPLLEDIDRIEVIRGPGATLWGANAVNGVVNVISKSTADTIGTYAGGGGGNEERGFAELRHGGSLGENASYRVWGSWALRDSTKRKDNGRQRPDDWSIGTGGVQLEHQGDNGLELFFQGQAHSSNSLGQALPGPNGSSIQGESKTDGGHVMARVSRDEGELGRWMVQAYYDVESRRGFNGFDDRRDTYDVDFRHQVSLFGRHELLWGAGYRHRRSRTEPSVSLALDPKNRRTNLGAGFIQDTVTLVDERLFLMLGSKFEHNDFTGFEIQPSGRLWWTPNERTTFWTAISRPVRTPSLVEEDLIFVAGPMTSVRGNRSLDAEKLLAYELGARTQLTPALMLDLTAFLNDHDDLIRGALVLGSDETFENVGSAYGYGVELSVAWQAMSRLRLEGSYTFYQLDGRKSATSEIEGGSPKHQAQIHSHLELFESLDFEGALYYVGPVSRFGGIDYYFRLDLGLLWKPHDRIELAIFGQNLTGDHVEYFQEGRVDTQAAIETKQ